MKIKNNKTIISICIVVALLIIVIILLLFIKRGFQQSKNNSVNELDGRTEKYYEFSEKDLKLLVDKVNKINSNFIGENYSEELRHVENEICVRYTKDNYKDIINDLTDIYSDPFMEHSTFRHIQSDKENEEALVICFFHKVCDVEKITSYRIEEKTTSYVRVYLNDAAYEVLIDGDRWQFAFPVMQCKKSE